MNKHWIPSVSSMWPLALLLSCSATNHDTKTEAAFPAGSEKAVHAVRAAFPDAVVSKVSLPQMFGGGAPDGPAILWAVEFSSNKTDRELQVTPDGVIVCLPTAVDPSGLPKAVHDALQQESAGAKVLRCERQETRATLRYAALAKPEVSYTAQLSKDGKNKQIELSAAGKVLQSVSMEFGGEEENESEEKTEPASLQTPKDAEIPPDAAKAVAAVKAILPNMVFRGVEEVGFLDGTSEMAVLNYEVEFYLDGAAKEWSASPDGIVIQVPKPMELEASPPAVRSALKNEPGWTVTKLVHRETRAGLKFVALPTPKVLYAFHLERDGKASTVRFKADGTKVKEIDPKEMLGG